MLSKKFLSIFIEKDYIKITEVSRNKDIIHMHKAVTVKTPQNSIENGFIKEKDAITHIIKQALEDNEIKSKTAVFIVGSSKIISREVSIPHVSDGKTKALIKMNASDYFPVNIDDYIIDYRVLERIVENKDGKQKKVLVVATPNMLINGYMDIAKSIGIYVKSIECSGNALFQVLKKGYPKGTNLFVDLGIEGTTVTILKDGKLELQRYIPDGIEGIYKAVMQQFNMDYEEVKEIMGVKSFLFGNEGNPYLLGEITKSINRILTGISRLLDFYNSRNTDSSLINAYLTGAGTKLLGIDRYIGEFLKFEVTIIDRYYYLQVSKKQDFSMKTVEYGECIGGSYETINLKPDIESSEDIKRKNKTLVTKGVLLAILVAVVVLFVPVQDLIRLKVNETSLRKKMDRVSSIQPIIIEHNEMINQLKVRETIMEASANPSEQFLEIIQEMKAVMPTGVYYLTFQHDVDSLTISGQAEDKLNVAKFFEKIEEMSYFSSIYIPSITELTSDDDNAGVSFSVTCVYAE